MGVVVFIAQQPPLQVKNLFDATEAEMFTDKLTG